MSSIYFPEDVLFNIFSRLPLKDIVRLTIVCRTFRAAVSHPYFIQLHLNLQTSDKFVVHYDGNDAKRYFSVLEDREFVNHWNLKTPFTSQTPFPRLLGSVNGLLCLSDSFRGYGRNLYLWNPSIWKFKFIPETCLDMTVFNLTGCLFALGFGFLVQTSDYKIVRIVYPQSSDGGGQTKAEVFSFVRNSWREIEMENGVYVNICCSTVVLNNCIHWTAGRAMDYAGLIWAFDLDSERFEEITLPSICDDGDGFQSEEFGPSLNVDVLQGLLALIVCYSQEFETIGCCDIWVMKEYGVTESWIKQYSLVPDILSCKCLGIMNGRDLILHTHDRKGVIFFDVDGQQQEYKPLEFAHHIDKLTPFLESLVLFHEGVRLNPRRQLRVQGGRPLGNKRKRSGGSKRRYGKSK